MKHLSGILRKSGKYAEFSIRDYQGDLKFGVVLLEKVESML